jgi:hypothetical protein
MSGMTTVASVMKGMFNWAKSEAIASKPAFGAEYKVRRH